MTGRYAVMVTVLHEISLVSKQSIASAGVGVTAMLGDSLAYTWQLYAN